MRSTLTSKLTGVFVAFAAVVLLGVNGIGFYKAHAALSDAAIMELEATAGEKEAAATAWMHEKQADVAALSVTPSVLQAVRSLLGAPPGSPEWEEIHNELVAEFSPRVVSGEFLDLFLLHPDTGKVIVAVLPGREGIVKADRDYFREGKNGAFITSIYFSPELGVPTLLASAPIIGEGRELLAVLAGRLNPDHLSAIIRRRSGLHKTDDAFLVNSARLVVTQPRFLPDEALLQQRINTVPVNLCLQKKSGTVFANDYRNVPVIAAYRWLPRHQLCLIVKIAQAEALAPIQDFGQNMIWMALAILGVATSVAHALSRMFVNPIQSMQVAAQRYGCGDLDVRLPENRRDELGMLAHEFNQMAASLAGKDLELNQHARFLETKVQERTKALQESNTQLQRAEEIGQLGNWEWDVPANRVAISAGLYRLLGPVAKDSGLGLESFFQFIHPEDMEKVKSTLESALQNNGPFDVEGRVIPPDGPVRTLYARGESVLDAQGKPLRLNGVAIDITERKQIETDLMNALEFTEQILTSSPVGIFTYKLSGECLSVNAAAVEMVGGTLEQLRAQNFHNIESWKRSGLYQMATQTISTGTSVRGDVHVLTSFGRDAWYTAQFALFQSHEEDLLLMMFTDITERKGTEAALAASEKRFRAWIEHSSDIVTVVDQSGMIQYESPSVKMLLGYDPEDLLGKNAFEFVHPEDQERIINAFVENILNPTAVITAEYRFCHRDGTWRYLEAIGHTFMDENHELVGLIHSRDITERKITEKALQEREALLDQTQALAHVGSWDLNLVTKRVTWSDEVYRIFGLGMDEFRGTYDAYLETLHAEDRQLADDAFSESVRNKLQSFEIAHRIIHQSSGEVRFVHIKCEHVSDAAGQIVRSRGMVQDITERKQAEEAILAIQRGFQALIENAPDGIALLGLDGKLRQVTPSTQQILGYSMEELIGQEPAQFTHPEDLPELLNLLSDLMQNPGKVSRTTYRFKHRDGSWRCLESTISSLITKPGVEAIVFNYRDITERKQAEKALHEKERLLSDAQRIGRIGSWSYDISSDTLTFSDEMYRLLDILPEEFRHNREDFLALVYPSDRFLASKWMDDIREGTQAKDLSFRLFHKNGELCYLNCTGAVEFDASAVPVRFIGTAQDVTERRAAEMQINQQIKRLTALSEIDRAIVTSFDQRYVLGVILSNVISQLQVDAAAVFVLDPEGNGLDYVAGQGFRTKMIEGAHVPLGEIHAGRAAKERRMIRIPDLRESTNSLPFNTFVMAEGFVSYVSLPLIVKRQVKGVLEVFQRSTLQPYQDWLDFFNALAGQTALAIENTRLLATLQSSNQELIQAYDATIEGWSRAMDLRDRETEGHTQRVTQLVLDLARRIGIEESRWTHIRRGALLHDIGKLGVPDHILFKPGELTVEERKWIERHVEFAYDMLAPIPYLKPALSIPYFHHEKWDGTGYPLGIKGEQIPLEARIFAVVDVWDALLSDRPHRMAWTRQAAMEYIRSQAGVQFDPRVVDCFLELMNHTP